MTWRTTRNQSELEDDTGLGTRAQFGADKRTVVRANLETDRLGRALPEGDDDPGTTQPDQSGYIALNKPVDPVALVDDPLLATACGAGEWVCGTGCVIATNLATFTSVADDAGLVSANDSVDEVAYLASIIVDELTAGELVFSAGGFTAPNITVPGTYHYEYIASSTAAPQIVGDNGVTSAVISKFAVTTRKV